MMPNELQTSTDLNPFQRTLPRLASVFSGCRDRIVRTPRMAIRHRAVQTCHPNVCRYEPEGTDIGLANVQRIVARHGGTTRAEDALGEGATVYLTLQQGTGVKSVEKPS